MHMLLVVAFLGALVALYLYRYPIFQPAALPKQQILLLAQTHAKSSSAFPLLSRVAVVTGATSGIGMEIAAELFGMGATVVLAGRSADRLSTSKAVIARLHPSSPGTLDARLLDTSDLTSVAAFAAPLLQDYRQLGVHYLVNNAGIHYVSDGAVGNLSASVRSAQGWDLAFATNFLGHLLLTDALLPLLVASGERTGVPSKVLQVSSTYHWTGDGAMLRPGDDGGAPEAASAELSARILAHREKAYGNNKLAQILHAKHLQRELALSGSADKVRALSFCPGFVATNILPKDLVGRLVASMAFSTSAGIVGALHALLDDSLPGGAFVTSFSNWLVEQAWSPQLLAWLRRSGLWGSAPVTALFAGSVLLFQHRSYGARVGTSSPESLDPELAAQLVAWSRRAVGVHTGGEA